jgi:hypothetical protein
MIAYRIIAKNLKTGVRVERQQIDGHLITDENQAWLTANLFAEAQQNRLGDQWISQVESYTPRS